MSKSLGKQLRLIPWRHMHSSIKVVRETIIAIVQANPMATHINCREGTTVVYCGNKSKHVDCDLYHYLNQPFMQQWLHQNNISVTESDGVFLLQW